MENGKMVMAPYLGRRRGGRDSVRIVAVLTSKADASDD